MPSRLAARTDGQDTVTATQYEAFMLHGERFCVGDAAFVMPDAFGMPYEMPKQVRYSSFVANLSIYDRGPRFMQTSKKVVLDRDPDRKILSDGRFVVVEGASNSIVPKNSPESKLLIGWAHRRQT